MRVYRLFILLIPYLWFAAGCTALHPFYESGYAALIWSPDGRYGATNREGWGGSGYAFQIVIDSWTNRTQEITSSVGRARFSGWTDDGRYAVFSASNQYRDNALIVFDTHDWHFVASVAGCVRTSAQQVFDGECQSFLDFETLPPRLDFPGDVSLLLTSDGAFVRYGFFRGG